MIDLQSNHASLESISFFQEIKYQFFILPGSTIMHISLSFRVFYFFSLVVNPVISAAYSAAIISFLMVERPSLPFTDISGIVKEGSYRFIHNTATCVEDLFLVSFLCQQLSRNIQNIFMFFLPLIYYRTDFIFFVPGPKLSAFENCCKHDVRKTIYNIH